MKGSKRLSPLVTPASSSEAGEISMRITFILTLEHNWIWIANSFFTFLLFSLFWSDPQVPDPSGQIRRFQISLASLSYISLFFSLSLSFYFTLFSFFPISFYLVSFYLLFSPKESPLLREGLGLRD